MFRRSPTAETLAAFAAVYLLQSALRLVAPATSLFLFVLAPPIDVRPWAIVTSVYAHGGLAHLLANAVALALVGFPLERTTSRVRFHVFFVTTGALAGVTQVMLDATLSSVGVGRPSAVLGASGAVFALLGYVLSANRLSDRLLRFVPLSGLGQVLVFAVIAAVLTLATGAPGVALVAHFTGFLLGLIAGRAHLLRTETQATKTTAGN
ncbi:MAG TPA: rhomboid family intramembrane serine protease [Natrialbaceae archaeon]|nr:rhomboid family intramembrane serine protease [Natrialbaceae archaeon]